jgi:hypothetical protein
MPRLQAAAPGSAEPQLVRHLLEIVIRAGRVGRGTPAVARQIWALTTARVVTATDPGRRTAAVQDLAHLSGTLVAAGLDPQEGRHLVGDLLTNLSLALRGRSYRAIRSMAIGLLDRDPMAGDLLEDILARPAASPVYDSRSRTRSFSGTRCARRGFATPRACRTTWRRSWWPGSPADFRGRTGFHPTAAGATLGSSPSCGALGGPGREADRAGDG